MFIDLQAKCKTKRWPICHCGHHLEAFSYIIAGENDKFIATCSNEKCGELYTYAEIQKINEVKS